MSGLITTEFDQLARQRAHRIAHDAIHTPRMPHRPSLLRHHAAAGLRRIAESLDG